MEKGNTEVVTAYYTTSEGSPDGGVAYGPGFTITWQRGPIAKGRNGAYMLEVLSCLIDALEQYQQGSFSCEENRLALEHLRLAYNALTQRKNRRMRQGTLGTHKV